MSNKIAFCLITVKPNVIWLDFLVKMTNDYDVFVMIDDDSNYDTIIKQYPLLIFIQINDDYCKSKGYMNANFIIEKKPSGWDKAMLYFTKMVTDYDHCWFCEDDVFFYNMNTIKKIDNNYPNSDLLCKKYNMNETGNMMDWHWHQAQPFFDLPWLNTMVCCCRLSNKLLSYIGDFSDKCGTITFVECLFPTVAHQTNLTIDTPSEFDNIHWRNKWENFELDDTQLYHPFKNIGDHASLRQTRTFS